ncbi:MAG: DNA polymerase III subunit delta [Planctomycetes bacterium]|nr:DNA polymerase III subunit delta [Planctomycetota bacterium]
MTRLSSLVTDYGLRITEFEDEDDDEDEDDSVGRAYLHAEPTTTTRTIEERVGAPVSKQPLPDDLTLDGLAQHLESGERLPAYAIIGEEPFARAQALKAIREAILKDSDPDLALSQYLGSDVADPRELFDELRTAPFLAPRRLVIVEDAASFAANARDALLAYLEKPSKTGTLVLVLEKLPRNDKLGIALRRVGLAVACEPPREYELPRWIAARARVHGKRLDPAAAKRLADSIGVNLPIVDQSLAKLALYVGPRDTITAKDVDALVEDLPVTTVFRLTDALGNKEPAKALRVLEILLAQNNEPPYILSMLRWALERLINARTLLDLRRPPDAIAKALHIKPGYFLDQTLKQARNRTRRELLRAFDLLLAADLASKTSTMDAQATLEHLLIRLCA